MSPAITPSIAAWAATHDWFISYSPETASVTVLDRWSNGGENFEEPRVFTEATALYHWAGY